MSSSIFIRLAAFAIIWWLISDGSANSWLIGIPAVVFATYTSWQLRSNKRQLISVNGAIQFLWFFIIESFKGSWDVACRALSRQVNVQPGFVQYHTLLPEGLPRVLLSSSVSLLPGTLTVQLDDNQLTIHTLTVSPDPLTSIAACERKIGKVFFNTDTKHKAIADHV